MVTPISVQEEIAVLKAALERILRKIHACNRPDTPKRVRFEIRDIRDICDAALSAASGRAPTNKEE